MPATHVGTAVAPSSVRGGRLALVKKRQRMTPEALRQRRVAFYHGIPRDTSRGAVRCAKGPPQAPATPADTPVDSSDERGPVPPIHIDDT
jgi:hypothetical protein